MIRLDRRVVEAVRAATHREELYPWLQNAIELEHSTIPPYLTAMFSLKPGTNDEIARLIQSIVQEEMLHMTIVGNILIAIGGNPAINRPGFIPKYPGPLPMAIGGSDFKVGIEAFSKPLVHDIFMEIEKPEHPIPVRTLTLEAVPDFATIGEFYAALAKKITEFGNSIFTVPASRQVLNWFDAARLFPIRDVETADKGIRIIVDEGEGTSTDPFQSPGDPAHYYKFGEIFFGRRLVRTATGFAYGGAPIPFDAAGVYPMKPNPKIGDFAPGTQARSRLEEFSRAYSNLLNALHTAFNGHPDKIDAAIGLMYELKMIAVSLMQTPAGDGSNATAGPSYEYIEAFSPAVV
jgi:disulfide oxidoreductase YuzD